VTLGKVLKGILIAVIVLLFVVILLDFGAAAGTERGLHPPFRVESQDGSRVFIYDWLKDWAYNLPLAGVYHNTNPPQLIYPVPIEYSGHFYISQDLNHFAVVPISNPQLWGRAISFYSYGALNTTYFVSDFVRNSNSILRVASLTIICTSPFYIWEDWQRSSFNADTGRLRISTREGLTYVFDLYTASMIAGPFPGIPSRYRPIVVLMLFVLVCAEAGRRIRARKSENTQGYKGKTAISTDYGYPWRF